MVSFHLLIMQNDEGALVELYIPRKCSSSSRIIAATDHAAVQIDLVDVDPKTGRMVPGKVIRYSTLMRASMFLSSISQNFAIVKIILKEN